MAMSFLEKKKKEPVFVVVFDLLDLHWGLKTCLSALGSHISRFTKNCLFPSLYSLYSGKMPPLHIHYPRWDAFEMNRSCCLHAVQLIGVGSALWVQGLSVSAVVISAQGSSPPGLEGTQPSCQFFPPWLSHHSPCEFTLTIQFLSLFLAKCYFRQSGEVPPESIQTEICAQSKTGFSGTGGTWIAHIPGEMLA